jgi:glycosyltransferase involved in cell wall biosynthesis
MSKIKVIHAIGGGEFGGAEHHILDLLPSLSELSVEPLVVCFYNSTFAEELRKRNIRVIPLDHYQRFDIRLLKALIRLFKEEKPDIIHTHGVKANFFCRIASRFLPKIPLVTTVHSVLRYDYSPLAYALASRLELWTRQWNDHFITISRPIQEALAEEGVNPAKISLVHNGIDADKFADPGDMAAIRRSLNLPKDSFVIGSICRLVPVKGLSDIMQAMALIVKAHPEVHWLLVGDGPEKRSLEAMAAETGISNRIHFAGFRKDIPQCMQAIDVYVSSSYSEGMPLSLLEAMAARKPVVTTMVGGIPDFITDGHNGISIPTHRPDEIAEKVTLLLEKEPLRNELTETAYRTVYDNFTLEHMSSKTRAVYERLLLKK